jgi:glc operon protein GlcG
MRKLLIACLCATGLLTSAELATKKALTLDIAKQMAAAAQAEAVKNKWNVVITIVDDGGHLVYLQRMDDVQIGSVDVAQAKARSAVNFRRPTKAFEDAVAGGRNAILTLPGAIPVEGGLPILVDGKVIGAIGVSGVTSQQDAQIGKAGVDALPGIIGK